MKQAEISATQHIQLTDQELMQCALDNHEGIRAANGALCVQTGSRTGRSPKDRFIVDDLMTTHSVDWGKVNQRMSTQHFEALWQKASDYLAQQSTYTAHLQVGADANYHLPVTVITELAWHNLFARHLFIRSRHTPDTPTHNEWTLLNAAKLQLDPTTDHSFSEAAIIINFSQRRVLICGTQYAGEMKKALFSVLNYLLPPSSVLPMHCAANVGAQGDVALFFGLSGTGKTTLSSDPKRALIGDDEHGWHADGVFNFEGGCYAKCIDLSEKNEPIIWQAIRDSAIMENVVLRAESGEPNYHDTHLTQNTRAAYPREHIPLRIEANQADQPAAVIFLSCDLYGVLPPVACLNDMQAAYYYLNGYTALLGSTEVGSTQSIKTTFSTGFGAAFLPRPPNTYADLLIERMRHSGAKAYLVNTGWCRGGYLTGGQRFEIPFTRQIIDAITTGKLSEATTETLAGFNVQIPTEIEGLDTHLLNPANSWPDPSLYYQEANQLIRQFHLNFQRFNVSTDITNAGPTEHPV